MVTSNSMNQRRSSLSPAKQTLLDQRLKGKLVQITQNRIPVCQKQNSAPLSSSQQRLWFLDQFQPHNPAYNITAALCLKGILDIEVLERSLNHIIERHDVLRTTFASSGENPVQIVAPTLSLSLPVVDLTHLPEYQQMEEVERTLSEESLQPFDLQRGPLLRTKLLRISAQEHILVLAVHHIVADAWSLGVVFAKELAANYLAFLRNSLSPLPKLPVQYGDFAAWQQQWLQENQQIHVHVAYWKQRLVGAYGILELPADYPRPPIQSFRGAGYTLDLPESLVDALRDFSSKEGVTLFMTLLAAFNVLLSRYTSQEDILIGTPIANRTMPELEHLIGFFANTLVLRTDLSGNPSFRELLRRVERDTTAAYAHQDLPFEKVVEEIQPVRDMSRSPLIQIMFAHNNTPMRQLQLQGLTASVMPFPVKNSKFDLTLMTEDADRGLRGYIEYNTDLFKETTIARLAGHLQTILESIVATPDQRVSELAMLTSVEREHILIDWNRTKRTYPGGGCLHQLIEEQVKRTPEQNAVSFEGQHLSYQELNERANQLAHLLRRSGVGSDVLVGVCLERSLELVISLLAVLKAGGAYVPLDPGYPRERLAYMREDARLSVLLTHSQFLQRLGTLPQDGKTIVMDELETMIAKESKANLENLVCEEHLVYVIYTSGSTGKPKGAMNSHEAVRNRLLWMQEQYPLAKGERILQKTPLSFDVSVWEFFWPLLVGAHLVLARPEGHRDPAYLVRTIQQYSISTIHFVPSMLQIFLQEPGVEQCDQVLGRIICSGEALPLDLQRRCQQVLPEVQLHNLYGPTEAAVDVTAWQCEQEDQGSIVPIGRPIANVEIHLLDPHMQPVPIGVAGELYIGGVAVGRGYWMQPALTAEKFVPDPLSSQPGRRLYKTGDLARYREDGVIEYLGRLDHQVKIRGVRIELGEIEAILNLHPSVSETIVLAREDIPGERQLVAYLVGLERDITASMLRDFLREHLPESMVPSTFVQLEAFPLSSNGKIDRRALPVPNLSTSKRESRYIAPQTSLERSLKNIWSDVLGVEQIGIRDSFFDIGGHSLKAMQIISRIQQSLGLTVPLRALFEDATIAGLTRVIEVVKIKEEQSYKNLAIQTEQYAEHLQTYLGCMSEEEVQQLLESVVPTDEKSSLLKFAPISFAQQRLWVLDQFDPGMTTYIIAGALHMTGRLHREALEQALTKIVSRHEILRTIFRTANGKPLQVILPPQEMTVPLHDLSSQKAESREEELKQLILKETERPFDLARGPLMRPVLYCLAQEEHVLLVTLHHIVFDGWSLGVFLQEFSQLYAAFTAGEAPALPELALHYRDFAIWQRQWLQGAVLEQQLSFWREHLHSPLPTLELPTDFARPVTQSFAGASTHFQLSAPATAALQALSQQEGATLFMSLLAAWGVVLARYSGQTDLVIGTPIANRVAPEWEALIGFFANTLVLRLDLSGEPTFRTLLQRVRQRTLDAYTHQDLPFERLIQELDLERDLSRNPLFQVVLALQNAPQPPLHMKDLVTTIVPTPTQTSKFDVSLHVWEGSEGLQGYIEYNTDLFKETTIARLAGHLQMMLESIVATPDLLCSHLALLTATERDQVLRGWNDPTPVTFPKACLHELFEQQVQQQPGNIALTDATNSLSYQELNERSNQLAHLLQAHGVGAGSLVGLSQERSAHLIVSILAILKAGATYVPLDPAYPQERLLFLIQDAGVQLVLTQARFAHLFVPAGITVFAIEDIQQQMLSQPDHNPQRQGERDRAAYIIYTSGSTGIPKGVPIPHKNVVHLFTATQAFYHFCATDVWTLFHSYAFDFSVWEIWGALLFGGRLVMVPQEVSRTPEAFYELLHRERVTVLNQTPSAFRNLIQVEQQPARRRALALRLVIFGGEALETSSLLPWFEVHGDQQPQLVNMYGITETTIHVTYRPVRQADALTAGTSRIGRTLPGYQVYVLDPQQQPVPVGVPGELYVSGAGLAPGYLRRPELTRERFLKNPFVEPEHECLYKTGDLVRWREEGELEYLGRNDQQVKIRGFRIELGEIATWLRKHVKVQDAMVLARSSQTGEHQLVAYLVPKEGEAQSLKLSELRSFLLSALPQYMIPAHFVVLSHLPLTPNGKLDFRALPDEQEQPLAQEVSYIAPRTATEQRVVEIWEQVLGRKPIGLQDNFFELGGDSLLAIQVVNQIREKILPNISLSSFFQAPTPAEIVSLIENTNGSNETDIPSLFFLKKGNPKYPPLICLHPIGGECFMYQILAETLDKERPVFGIQSQTLGENHWHLSVEAIAREYSSAIRKAQPEGPYYLLGWSTGGLLALAVAAELEQLKQKVAFVGLLDTFFPFYTKDAANGEDLSEVLGLVFGPTLIQAFLCLSLEQQNTFREQLLSLPELERLQQVIQWGQERGVLPATLTIDTFRTRVALMSSHRQLFKAYRPPIIDAPLVVWWANQVQQETPSRTKWEQYSRGSVQEMQAEGNHFSMIQLPHIHFIAQQLERVLGVNAVGITVTDTYLEGEKL